MARYNDLKVSIAGSKITIKGIFFPYLSNITIDGKDILSIKEIELSLLQRFNMLGTQNLKTWWCFDESRFLRKKGFIVTVTESVGPMNQIGFTVTDHDRAKKVLEKMFPDLLH